MHFILRGSRGDFIVNEALNDISRRRIPRRNFEAPVGVLVQGHYHVARAHQVGEGGMMISSPYTLEVGNVLVVSFYLNKEVVIVRGTIRNKSQPTPGQDRRFGLEFDNLGFLYKREIRNFVASQA